MQKLKSFFSRKPSACVQEKSVHISNKRACSGDKCKRTICNHCNSKSNIGYCKVCSEALDYEIQTYKKKLESTVPNGTEEEELKGAAANCN